MPLYRFLSFAWDEADLDEAATEGDLETVDYADYEILIILGVFSKFTVTAYGN